MRRALLAGGLAALALPAAALAIPPGGTAPQPGTPAGTLTVTTPAVAPQGTVGFCVANLRVDTSSGPVAQAFMLKFDDFGSGGIGPYTPDANGTLCGTVSTDPASYPDGAAADRIPADLCDGTKEHWLRLLSGPWAHPDASQRSIAAEFTVTGSCAAGTPAPAPTPTPPSGGAPAPGSAPTPTPPAAAVALRSTTLAADARRVTVKLAGGASFARGVLTLRTRLRVRLGHSAPARRTLARGAFQLAAGDRAAFRLTLTADGRALLRVRPSIAATLAIGTDTTTNVTVRRPRAARS